MKATTHQEIYRPFEGTLLPSPRRPLTLAWSGIRLGFRRKLPAALLFSPPAITGIVSSVRVHLMYLFSEQAAAEGGLAGLQAQSALESLLGDVADNVVTFVTVSAYFALLAMTWFGAGLIADDRRLGANLLYFSRPLSRSGYILGKWLAVSFFGVLTLLVPTTLILLTAILSSPDWSFLTQQPEVIAKSYLYCFIWIALVSTLVLGLSSLVERKTIALALSFGTVIVLSGIARAAAEILDQPSLTALSLPDAFSALSTALFHPERLDAGQGTALGSLVLWFALPALILFRRVRKMEVVG